MTIKLSPLAIMALRGNKEVKDELARVLGVDKPTIYKYIRTNDDNLTKVAALQVIRFATGLRDEDLFQMSDGEAS